jgi:phage baseplate assembly protein W
MATASAKVYSFKSVGQTLQSQAQAFTQVENPPIGIKTPLRLGEGSDGLLAMHRSLDSTIADNIRNLILTNKGERLFDYSFGANIKELIFELGTEEGDNEAIKRIASAVSFYMPFVVLDTFETVIEPQTETTPPRLLIRIGYTVTGFEDKPKKIEVSLTTVN